VVKRWRRSEHEGFAAFLFLLPSLAGFLVFTAIPVGAAFVLAFYDYDLLLGASFAGLENFKRLLSDDVFISSFLNTLYFVSATVPLTVVLGLAAAMLANQALRGVVIFRSVFLLPYVMVTVAVALVWKWIFLPDAGLLNTFLGLSGIDGPAWLTSQTWAMPALIIMSVWKFFGFSMVLYLAALQNIPQHLHEAALVDGATPWKRFWRVTFPLLSPMTLFLLVTSTVFAFFDAFAIADIFQGGPLNATSILIYDVYENAFRFDNRGLAAAQSLLLFVAVGFITVLQLRQGRKRVTYQ
jgi:multiple sugar transport system permease protein